MGDYLNDIASKNLGLAKTIQPRRGGRFEPSRTGIGPDPGFGELYEETSAGETEPRQNPGQTPYTGTAVEESLHRTGTERIIETYNPRGPMPPEPPVPSGPRGQLTVNSDETVEIKARAQPERETKTEVLTPKKSVPETKVSRQTVDVSVETTEAPFVPRTTLSPPDPAAVEQKETIPDKTFEAARSPTNRSGISIRLDRKRGASANVDTTADDTTAETTAGETTAKTTAGTVAGTDIVIRPRVAEGREPRKETIKQQANGAFPRSRELGERFFHGDVSEPPVINVTIGRVEVRAVTAPAPPRETRTRPKTVSLDEYLHRRGNGGER